MAETRINVSQVMNSASKGTSAQTTVANVEGGIERTKAGIDSKILCRSDIGFRLNSVKYQIGQIENDIAQICGAISSAALRYQSTENRVVNMANSMMGIKISYTKPSTGGNSSNAACFHGPAINQVSENFIQGRKAEAVSIKDNVKGMIEKTLKFVGNEERIFAHRVRSEGIQFGTYRGSNGKIGLQLKNVDIYETNYKTLASKLNKYITDEKLDKLDLKNLLRERAPIYKGVDEHAKEAGKILDGLKERAEKLKKMDLDTQGKVLENWSNALDSRVSFSKSFQNAGKTFCSKLGENLQDSLSQFTPSKLKEIVDFRDWKFLDNAGKFDKVLTSGGKALGVVGDAVATWENVKANFRDENGHWDFNGEAFFNTVADTAIDFSTSAAAMATGAALGSFIAPPIGTVVGAAAGVAIDFVINMDFDGDGKSVVDNLKDGADKVIDAVGDGFTKMVDKVKKWFS